jgi:hypothetical protein
MNVTSRLAGLLIFALLFPSAASPVERDVATGSDAKNESGFMTIFDGKTLEGWAVMPESAAGAWSVENGTIVGVGDKGRSYLTLKDRQLANFELKLNYRFEGKGNSGISIRPQPDETRKRAFKSYHADFGHVGIGKQVLGAWDFHTPGRTEHACCRGDRLVIDRDDKPTVTKIENAVTLNDIRKGDWNDVHLIAKGNNFQFYINGKLSSEFTEHIHKDRRLDKGWIQLQLHDPGMIVHFKNIRLKLLD